MRAFCRSQSYHVLPAYTSLSFHQTAVVICFGECSPGFAPHYPRADDLDHLLSILVTHFEVGALQDNNRIEFRHEGYAIGTGDFYSIRG